MIVHEIKELDSVILIQSYMELYYALQVLQFLEERDPLYKKLHEQIKNQLDRLTLEHNTPRHVFAILELKKNIIRHFALDKILEYVKSVKVTNDLHIITESRYPFVVSYSRKAHSKIVNIAPFNTDDLARVSYINLYGSMVYAYTFDSIINGKLRIPDNMAQPISNYINHLFVQVFGRAYGLVGTYSAKLPGLKFLITAYVLIAFFGRKQDKATFNEARGFSGYQYNDKLDTLMKHDLSDIHGLTKLLSEMDVMPGMNIIKFTTAIYDRFGTQMMPGFEDLSRFLSLIMTSSIGVQTIARSVISKFQRDMYVRMLKFMERRLF